MFFTSTFTFASYGSKGDLSCSEGVVHFHFHFHANFQLYFLVQPGDLSCNEIKTNFHFHFHFHLCGTTRRSLMQLRVSSPLLSFSLHIAFYLWFKEEIYLATKAWFTLTFIVISTFTFILRMSCRSAKLADHFHFPHHFALSFVCGKFLLDFSPESLSVQPAGYFHFFTLNFHIT